MVAMTYSFRPGRLARANSACRRDADAIATTVSNFAPACNGAQAGRRVTLLPTAAQRGGTVVGGRAAYCSDLYFLFALPTCLRTCN